MHNDLRKVRRIVEGSKSWETRRVRTLDPTDPKHGIGHRLSVRHWPGPTGRPHRTRVASSSVGLALLLLCAPAFAAQLECRVASVTRGDTLMCLTIDNRQELIRLRGIDSPGRKEPFGEHARQHLADLAHGKSATVHWTYRDHHGRIIGAVWVEPVDCQAVAIPSMSAGHNSHPAWPDGRSDTPVSSQSRSGTPTNSRKAKRAPGAQAYGASSRKAARHRQANDLGKRLARSQLKAGIAFVAHGYTGFG